MQQAPLLLLLCASKLPAAGCLHPLPVPTKPYASTNNWWPAIAVTFPCMSIFLRLRLQKVTGSWGWGGVGPGGGFGHIFNALSSFLEM